MSKKKPPPAVVLQSVFARDHQRRLRLVIDLLEEARRQPIFRHNRKLTFRAPSRPRHIVPEESHEDRRDSQEKSYAKPYKIVGLANRLYSQVFERLFDSAWRRQRLVVKDTTFA